MRMFSKFVLRLRSLFRPQAADRELDDELRFHLESTIEQNLARGMTPAEARRRALVELGGVEQAREGCRDARGVNLLQDLRRDLRYGLRLLRKSPGFAAIAILTLALGIGANAAIFSVIEAVLLRPLPYKDPGRIVMIWHVLPPQASAVIGLAPWGERMLLEFHQAHSLETIAAFRESSFNLTGTAQPNQVDGIRASAELFRVLGVQPELGHTFTKEEDRPDNDHYVLLSDGLWRQMFGGDPHLIGKTIRIDSEPYVVLGVMPPNFEFPLGAEMPPNFGFSAKPALWIPSGLPDVPRRGPSELAVIGKLKPGVTIGQATADFALIENRLERKFPITKGWLHAQLVPLRTQAVGGARLGLLTLMAAVVFLLLITCANVSNLLLVRAIGRGQELSLRAALGAGRARIARQLLAESLLLALAGTVCGIGVAWAGLRVIVSLAASRIPRIAGAHVDLTLVGYSLLLACAVTLLFGTFPAWRASRMNLAGALKAGPKSSGGSPARRMQAWLVVAEVALSVVLLAGSGLLIRSFLRLLEVDPGFHAARALTFEVSLPKQDYPNYESMTAVYRRIVEHLARIPSVEATAIGNVPMTGTDDQTAFIVEGAPPLSPEHVPIAEYVIAGPNYFRSLGIPIRKGRGFRETDTEHSQPVVVLNETMAARLWPGQDPLGKRIRMSARGFPWLTVIGVVNNVKVYSLGDSARLEMFVPYTQKPFPSMRRMQFVVRTAESPAATLSSVRAAVATVDANLPVAQVRTVREIVQGTLTPARFSMFLLAAFGALALILAATGIYGVLSHQVAAQTREIGIRLAIGASPGSVLKMEFRRGMTLVIIGAVAGTVVAFAFARVMRTLLFGITQSDPVSYALAVLTLAAAAALACYVPARRAMRVDPMTALRHE
jgi:predicted permease